MGERRKRTQPGIIKVRTKKSKHVVVTCQNYPDGRFRCFRSSDIVVTIEHPNPKESEIFMCNQCFNFEITNNQLFKDRIKNRVLIADYKKK